MEKDYERNGFCLEYKTRLGYILKITDKNKFETYLEKLPDYIVESPEQRLDSIIVELLLKDGYKTIESLSDKFLVSTSQIKNDLKKIDDRLLKYDLRLDRKPHYGLKVEGHIDSIQKLIRELYVKKNRNFMKYKMTYVSKAKIVNIKSTIKNIFNEHSLEVNITELEEILSQLVILYIKTSLRKSSDVYMIDKKEDDEVLEGILSGIFHENRYYFTPRENDYLKRLIREKTKDKKAASLAIDKSKLEEVIYEYFKEVDKRYSTSFLEDKEFLKLLYLHIAALIERSKNNQSISNPFSVKISQQYPTVFNLAIQLSKRIEQEYDIEIDQNEIGFIATHIAVPFEKREKNNFDKKYLSLIHISEPTRPYRKSRMPSSA